MKNGFAQHFEFKFFDFSHYNVIIKSICLTEWALVVLVYLWLASLS